MRLISKSPSVILCFFFFLFCLLSFDVLRAEDVIEGKEDGEDVNEETESSDDEKDSDQEEEEIEETNNKDEGDEDEKDDEDTEEKGEDKEEVDAPATDDDNKEEGDEDEKDEDKEEKGEDKEEVDAPATDDDNKEEGDEDKKDEDKEEKGEDKVEVDAPATDDDNKEEGDEDEKEDKDKEEKGEDDKKDDDDDDDDDEKNEEGEVDDDKNVGGDEGDEDKKEEGDDMETVQPDSEGLQDTTTEEEKEEEKMETVLKTGQSSKNEDGETGEANEEDKGETEPDKEGDWSYRGPNGPGNWSKSFSDCRSGDERLQSPININSDQSTFTADDDQSLDAIELTANDGTNTTIAHKDHTVKLFFDKIIRVNGLGKTVKVKEAQFRWGETETTGSEHSIDGKRYPLEMQIFAFDEDDFASFEDAIEADSGGNVSSSSRFIVLATLFELSTADNPSLTEITKNLESIQNPGDRVVVDSFDLKDLLPEKTDYYFRYAGSLTFPPCVERGDWIVFRQRQTVSLAQLEKFRHLYEERTSDDDQTNAARIAFNYRPVQPLNGRIVTRTFPVEAVPPVGKEPAVGKEEASVDEEEDQVPKPPASAIGNGNAADAVKIRASVSLAFPLLALLWKVIR